MADIEDIAAEWAVKIDAGPLGPGEEAALDAWLSADTRHSGAFGRARAALAFANGDRIGTGRADSDRQNASYSRRAFVLAGSVAASGAGLWALAPYALRALGAESYATQLGETKVVPLPDGSVVTLNTNSRIDVRYSKDRREIHLIQGEALFDVAHNKQRPFFVLASNTQVRAVGTSFTVKLLPDQPVQVLVREGIVEIKHPDVPVAPPVRIAANTKAVAPANAPIAARSVPAAEINRALEWRVGRIALEGETLREAVAEFARYSDTRIEIDAPDVADQTVAGLFVSNDPVGFSKAVAASFKLRMEVSDRVIRLSH